MTAENRLADVLAAMTPAERDMIVTRFTAFNPQLRGGGPADYLDLLDQNDEHLDLTEPFYEANPDLAVPGANFALLALIYARPDGTPGGSALTRAAVSGLLQRAGLT